MSAFMHGLQFLIKENEQAGQQQHIGEQGDYQCEAGQNTQVLGAFKFREGEYDEAEEQDDGGIDHAHTCFLQGHPNGISYVETMSDQFLSVFGQEMDGIIDRYSECHTENEYCGWFQRNMKISHDGSCHEQRQQVRQQGQQQHAQ